MPKVQFWDSGLRRLLTTSYEYEPSEGQIFKVKYNDKGVLMSKNGVGSLNFANEVIVNVPYEGRICGLRATKIAVFLKTGEQHHRFSYRDGNKANNKWENIIVEDSPSNNQAEMAANRVAVAHIESEERKAERVSLEKMEAMMEADPTYRKLSAHKFVKLTPEQLARKERKQKEAEKEARLKTDAEEFLRNNPKGYWEFEREDDTILNEEYAKLEVKYKDDYERMWIYSFTTGMSVERAQWVWEKATAFLEYPQASWGEHLTRLTEKFPGEDEEQKRASGISKLEWDLLMFAWHRHWIEKDQMPKVCLENWLKEYKWKGEEMPGGDDLLTGERQAEYNRDEARIIREHKARHQAKVEQRLATQALTKEQAGEASHLLNSPSEAVVESEETNILPLDCDSPMDARPEQINVEQLASVPQESIEQALSRIRRELTI